MNYFKITLMLLILTSITSIKAETPKGFPYKSNIRIDLLGNSTASLVYSRPINDRISIGAGFGLIGLAKTDNGTNNQYDFGTPISIDYYFYKNNPKAFYISGSVTTKLLEINTIKANGALNGFPTVPSVFIGYEFCNTFLFQIKAGLNFLSGGDIDILPMIGLNFGIPLS